MKPKILIKNNPKIPDNPRNLYLNLIIIMNNQKS